MFNTDTDLLFPARAIPALRGARGAAWEELVDRTLTADVNSSEQAAFILMMARMNNCGSCNADSYRAMNGCTACSKQSIKRFHGSDTDLVTHYETIKSEIDRRLSK